MNNGFFTKAGAKEGVIAGESIEVVLRKFGFGGDFKFDGSKKKRS